MCGKPLEETISQGCAERLRGEALEKKRTEEKAD